MIINLFNRSAFSGALLCLALLAVQTARADDAGSLLKRATISCDKAEAIALEKYPGATVKEIKLDGEDLPLTWEIELRQDKLHIDLDIDAKSGEITHTDKHK